MGTLNQVEPRLGDREYVMRSRLILSEGQEQRLGYVELKISAAHRSADHGLFGTHLSGMRSFCSAKSSLRLGGVSQALQP